MLKTQFYPRSAAFFWLPAISSYRCSRAANNKTLMDVTRIEVCLGWMCWQVEFFKGK